MSNLLVLAYESPKDLPPDWFAFDRIDTYGPPGAERPPHAPENFRLHETFFNLDTVHPNLTYELAWIPHPDPWGEPRNWLQAIAALSTCLQGDLHAEFWFPSEIAAFHALLTAFFDTNRLSLETTSPSNPIGTWKNHSALWIAEGRQTVAQATKTYRSNKHSILEKFYTEIGPTWFTVTDLDIVSKALKNH